MINTNDIVNVVFITQLFILLGTRYFEYSGKPAWLNRLIEHHRTKNPNGDVMEWRLYSDIIWFISAAFAVVSLGIYVCLFFKFDIAASNSKQADRIFYVLVILELAFIIILKGQTWTMHAIDMFQVGAVWKGSSGSSIFWVQIAHSTLVTLTAIAILVTSICVYQEPPDTKAFTFFISAWVIIVVISIVSWIMAIWFLSPLRTLGSSTK